ncbi:MAG: lysylphosphatidylglycerol synthase transmembrane domain-containing protein [Terrimicrobiaceae bacterium]|nr:flippase-like domain-containing protein [Terrimicrobiaceae bacterium]
MKKILLPVAQILITIGLLCWIFRDPEQNRKMLEAIGKAQADGGLWWFLPGLAALGIALLLQTRRWIILLRVQNITISFWRALRIMLSGMFFNLFLLGSTGGDVIKIFFIMRETPDKKAGALLSVFVDRVVGMLALATVSAAVILARWEDLMKSAPWGVLTVALILGGSLGFIFAAWLVDRLHLTSKLPHWLPMHAKIAEAAAAFSQYAKAGGAVGRAFLLSLPAHLLIFSTFYFAAKAFGAGLGPISVFCVMPVVSTVTALPISLGGAGVREGLFITLLGDLYRTPKEIAMSISISGFLMIVFWSLIGGLVYLLYRSSSPGTAKISDMEKSVGEFERHIEENAERGRGVAE